MTGLELWLATPLGVRHHSIGGLSGILNSAACAPSRELKLVEKL